MALSLLTAEVDNVSQLSDQPNDIEGMSAEELKAVFDAGVVAVKSFLNEVHIPEVEDAIGAAARGITLDGLSGNVLADNTVGSDKLKSDEGFEAVNTSNIRAYAVTLGKLSMDLQALLSKLQANYQSLATALGTKATYASLPEVAKTGSYNDILDKPFIPPVDAELSDSSTATNPVQNRILTAALNAKAKTNHADTTSSYGLGDATKYGHLKLSDSYSSSTSTSGGTAATPKAVKDAYDRGSAAINNLATHAAVAASNSNLGHIKMAATTVTLEKNVTSWSKTPSGVTFSATDIVFVAPAGSSYSQWADNNIYCSSQGANSLTFAASTAPTAAVTVNVVVLKTA